MGIVAVNSAAVAPHVLLFLVAAGRHAGTWRDQDRTRPVIAREASVISVSVNSPPRSMASLMQSRRWSSSKERATRSRALVTAEIWVRTSRQCASSSTMRCNPRIWPSARLSRLWYALLLGNVTNFLVSHFDSLPGGPGTVAEQGRDSTNSGGLAHVRQGANRLYQGPTCQLAGEVSHYPIIGMSFIAPDIIEPICFRSSGSLIMSDMQVFMC